MKKITESIRYLFIIGALYLLTAYVSIAQTIDHGGKFGLQYNGVMGVTEFKEYENSKTGYLGRAFLRFGVSEYVEAEVGAGYGKVNGLDFSEDYYETVILPFDTRFLIRPFNSDSFNPYLFAGIGVLSYDVKDYPIDQQTPDPEDDGKGWVGMLPVGLGFEFEIVENVLLDVNGTFTYTFTDDLNHFARGANDAYAALGLGIVFVSDNGGTDKDNDGLIKSEEKIYGTDSNNPDTDFDGVNDGDEVHTYKTNPLKKDTDSDGISDSDELNKYLTNPTKQDSDNDGIEDIKEIEDYRTEPTKADTDADGLDDGEEINKYKTDPLKADTDSDGLQDGAEVQKYNTDPLNNDSDGDGLSDGDEISKYKTNPMNTDSDTGTVSDKIEVDRGTNPLDADDDVVKVNAPMILEGVTFASGKSAITPESAEILKSSLKTLKIYGDIFVEIRGYTDNVGNKSSNIKLSQKRADSVKNWLIGNGIDAERVNAVGYGPNNQLVPNDSQENRRKNRRIEFVRVK